ncbi:MAG: substrate-binding domain-containing protein [Steroidobacteraceae bacterium]
MKFSLRMCVSVAGLLLGCASWITLYAESDGKAIVVASTTSTQDSGLFDYLLPIFKQKTGIIVRVIAQGTGQALDTGRRGDADVVFVHSKAAELKFVADGESLRRYPVMYNDFVLIGPKSDPAGVRGTRDIGKALRHIRAHRATFVSRGDRSGTYLAEVSLWKAAGVDIEKERGAWYKSIGQGMGAALNFAAATNGYVLADRATWLHFRNRGDLQIVVQGDSRLFNQYGVMLVNPQKHPNVKKDLGQQFIDYLVSPEGQRDIANYKIDGQQLFYPDAGDAGARLTPCTVNGRGGWTPTGATSLCIDEHRVGIFRSMLDAG